MKALSLLTFGMNGSRWGFASKVVLESVNRETSGERTEVERRLLQWTANPPRVCHRAVGLLQTLDEAESDMERHTGDPTTRWFHFITKEAKHGGCCGRSGETTDVLLHYLGQIVVMAMRRAPHTSADLKEVSCMPLQGWWTMVVIITVDNNHASP